MSFDRKLFIEECKNQEKSEQYIVNTLKYADNLVNRGFPVLFSLKHMAYELGINYEDLKTIEDHRENYYKHFHIKKKKGGLRHLSVPFTNLKLIQSWIYHNILLHHHPTSSAYGYIKNRSIKENADQHVAKRFILNVDLLKFFETITEHKVFKLFVEIGYTKTLSWSLSKLVTVPIKEDYYLQLSHIEQKLFNKTFEQEYGVLPQGAPTSPSISNLVLRNLDGKMVELAELKGSTYTRYADDITFSGNDIKNIPTKTENMRVVMSENLLINWNKWTLRKKGMRQKVTGLNTTHGLSVPKSYRKDVKRHIHFCLKYGPERHQKKIGDDKQFYRYWRLGRIHYIRFISPEIGNKMLKDFNNIQWPL